MNNSSDGQSAICMVITVNDQPSRNRPSLSNNSELHELTDTNGNDCKLALTTDDLKKPEVAVDVKDNGSNDVENLLNCAREQRMFNITNNLGEDKTGSNDCSKC